MASYPGSPSFKRPFLIFLFSLLLAVTLQIFRFRVSMLLIWTRIHVKFPENPAQKRVLVVSVSAPDSPVASLSSGAFRIASQLSHSANSRRI
jgi:hypothetical protein